MTECEYRALQDAGGMFFCGGITYNVVSDEPCRTWLHEGSAVWWHAPGCALREEEQT